jgi:hypothetical protein
LEKEKKSMKKQTLILASLCLVVGLATASAHAQAGGVKAKVPFDFSVSGKTLPAGDYMMIASSHLVSIESADGKIVAKVLANELSGQSAGRTGRIIFHCYRYRCFLAEVWSPAHDNGRELARSRAEATLAKEEKGKFFAVMGEEPLKRH